MIINNTAEEKDLGLVNGLGQSMASAARCLGPAIGGLVWSLSVRIHFLFLNFIVVSILLVIAIMLGEQMSPSVDYAKKDAMLGKLASTNIATGSRDNATGNGTGRYSQLPVEVDEEEEEDSPSSEFV